MKKIMLSVALVILAAVSAMSAGKTCRQCQNRMSQCAAYCDKGRKDVSPEEYNVCMSDCNREFRACISPLIEVCPKP